MTHENLGNYLMLDAAVVLGVWALKILFGTLEEAFQSDQGLIESKVHQPPTTSIRGYMSRQP
jgi:hypothetical protein